MPGAPMKLASKILIFVLSVTSSGVISAQEKFVITVSFLLIFTCLIINGRMYT